MSQPSVRVHVHGAAGTIILNRPERRNALSRELLAELSQAIGDLHQERRVRAVILTGTGSAFCAGMDLAEMQAAAEADNPHEQWRADAVQYLDLIEQMLRFPKPLIAAVNGSSIAGGAGLALASDIVIAADTATFGFPEPRRGIVAGLVTPLLAFRVGAGQAAPLLLTGGVISAHEAQRIGVFHRLTEPDHLWPRATEIAAECAECAPEALLLTKQLLNETIGEPLFTLLSAGAAASATSRTTEAAVEGLKAFFEKRLPKWL